jgi:hypothetical protein
MAMAFYEIRSSITRHRTSLVSLAEFPNDLTAILAARDLVRQGETIEVWRETVLVYRSGAPVNWTSGAGGATAGQK